jgi:mannose/fructose/N-acetylgalactosamine-specific phosphotransferase system component IIC
MAQSSGNGLIVAGTIVTVVGLCIVLIKVFQVPEYWVPLMVGLGLLAMGLVRRATSGRSARSDGDTRRD